MFLARACSVPAEALLSLYADAYVDAFFVDVAGRVSLSDFVEAFYSSRAFRLELFVVGLLFARPWSDAMARELSLGQRNTFSAWRVEARTRDELLMHEAISDKTRSWLMARSRTEGGATTTRLYFGTAIRPVGRRRDGEPRMSILFALKDLHRLYARLLLASAARRLMRRD